MKLWILEHHHKHGVDVFPVYAEAQTDLPEPAELIKAGGSSLEPSDEEWTEWVGPFDLPGFHALLDMNVTDDSVDNVYLVPEEAAQDQATLVAMQAAAAAIDSRFRLFGPPNVKSGLKAVLAHFMETQNLAACTKCGRVDHRDFGTPCSSCLGWFCEKCHHGEPGDDCGAHATSEKNS